jgi:hypothetical protein
MARRSERKGFPNDGRKVFLNTLKGEPDNPLYRRGALVRDTPLEIPRPCELAQVFKGWLSHNL